MEKIFFYGNHQSAGTVRQSTPGDYPDWIRLAREVEPLFGPMVDDPGFGEGLRKAISERNALCVREDDVEDGKTIFHGGIVISREANEIVWLAVGKQSRGQKIGARLLSAAIDLLNPARPITVTTFDKTVEAGIPARNLYIRLGFRDFSAAGLNPAGIPTVVMTLNRS